MATLIRTNGTQEEITIPNDDSSLEVMQKAVGGFIEMVDLYDGRWFIVNEEGKLLNLPVNKIASDICEKAGRHETIVGDVLLCSENEIDEDD